MSDFPTTRTNENATSFWQRYEAPLARYASRRLRVDHDTAADLARDFCLKQLERERASRSATVHESYAAKQERSESRWWPSHGFRRFVATAFYRFCRDELAKRHGTVLLDREGLETFSDERTDPLGPLIVRDVLASVRDEVLAPWPADAQERRFYDAKWPPSREAEVATDAAVERALGCSRAELRTIKRHVVDRVVFVLHRRVVEEGWSPHEARLLLVEAFEILDALEPPSERP